MTTVADLVTALEAEGFHLRERDGRLIINPASSVTPTIKETLTVMGREVVTYLRGRRGRPDVGVGWMTVSLYRLDRVLEVAVPWSDTNLVIAPGCRIAGELRSKDPRPGRIWCACEVLELLLTGVGPEDARKVAEAKLAMGGTVTAVGQERRG